MSKPSDKGYKRLLIPLIKSETGDRNFDVKIVFRTDISVFSFAGKIAPPVIRTGDLPVVDAPSA